MSEDGQYDWYEDHYGTRYDDEYPCPICGGGTYCDPVTHAEYETRLLNIDCGLKPYKCSECGGQLSISDDWGMTDLATISEAWVRCCVNGCGVTYTILYDNDLNVVGVWRGYMSVNEAKYRKKPIDLSTDDIPF